MEDATSICDGGGQKESNSRRTNISSRRKSKTEQAALLCRKKRSKRPTCPPVLSLTDQQAPSPKRMKIILRHRCWYPSELQELHCRHRPTSGHPSVQAKNPTDAQISLHLYDQINQESRNYKLNNIYTIQRPSKSSTDLKGSHHVHIHCISGSYVLCNSYIIWNQRIT